MGSVQYKAKCAMHTKGGVRTETSISHSILCALHTSSFYSVERGRCRGRERERRKQRMNKIQNEKRE